MHATALVLRTGKARALLERADFLLEQLEILNLGGVVNASPKLEEAVALFLGRVAINAGDRTVQTLLDGLFEGQAAILEELRICRVTQEARGRASGR